MHLYILIIAIYNVIGENMKRAVVLSGGGAKGAYQIGVWKALRKLKINYSIVTGTSVGALNGAFMVQNNYWKAVHMWYYMNFSRVFEHMDGDYHTLEGKKKILLTYAKGIINGGMNIQRLEQTLEKYLNPKKFYRSPIDFGLVTVNLTDLKALSLKKEEIKPEELKDYLIASASCFPAFPAKIIHGKKYIDGGYYDNLPIQLAIDLGAEEVIAVDLKAIGRKQKVKDHHVPITYITPQTDIGSFLIFDKTLARRAIRLGYYDTLKIFQKLEGTAYTFRLGEVEKITEHYVKPLLQTLEKQYQEEIMYKYPTLEAFALEMIDFLGHSFHIPEDHIYTARKFHRLLMRKYRKTEVLDFQTLKKLFKKKDQKIPYMGMILKYWCQTKNKKKETEERFHFLSVMKISAFYLEYYQKK